MEAAIKRQKDFESVYCVIDRDTHHNFDAALARAATELKVRLITSYPCFEFWLLLHFCYSRAPYTSVGGLSAADRVIQDLRTKPEMDAYAKGATKNLFDKLLPMLPQARNHAGRTLVDAEQDGELNPSTPLHLLLTELEELAGLKPA